MPTSGRARLRSAAATLLGALTLVGGLTWVLLNLHGPHQLVDAVVGAMLATGGLVLLMPHRVRLPGPLTTAAAAGVAVAGTAAGLVARSAQACCHYLYAVARGFPFHWLQRGAIADDAGTARRLAGHADWHVDAVALAGNLLFWAYAGMLIVVVLVLVRRREARRRPVGPLP